MKKKTILFFLATPIALTAVDFTWSATGSGNWSDAGNWSHVGGPPNIPNAATASAIFGSSITSDATISLDLPITLNNLYVTAPSSYAYTITPTAPTNTLSFDTNGEFYASLVCNQTPLEIECDIGGENLNIVNFTAGTLTVSGSISNNQLLLNGIVASTVTLNEINVNAFLPSQGTVKLLGTVTTPSILLGAGLNSAPYPLTIEIPAGDLVLNPVNGVSISYGGFGSKIVNFDIALNASLEISSSFFDGGSDGSLVYKLGEGVFIVNTPPDQVSLSQVLIVEGTWSSSAAMGFGFICFLQGGKAQIRDNLSFPDTVFLVTTPSFFDTNGFSATISTEIQDTSYFTKIGEGTLYLANTSNFNTFGGVVVQEGTLNIAGERSLGALTSQLGLAGGTFQIASSLSLGALHSISSTNNASQIDTQAFNLTINSNITGSGGFHKIGSGNLILTGTNTFAGPLQIDAGTVQGGASQLPSSIVNHATLIFDQTGSGTYGSAITGTDGVMHKIGSGTLNLQGGSVTQSSITVSAGTLAINAPVTVSSSFTVEPGATLKGVGPLSFTGGTILNQGTLQPGNSIGTFHVSHGNYTQATGSTLEIEISPTGSDLLSIDAGVMSIESGTALFVFPAIGSYAPNQSYSIVYASGGFPTGLSFDTVTIDPPLFQLEVNYLPNDITLTVNILPIGTLINTGNIGRLVTCLDAANPPEGSDLENIIDQLVLSSEAQMIRSLEMMQPSLFTALAVAAEETTFRVQQTIARREKRLFEGCTPSQETAHFWIEETVSSSFQNTRGSEPGFHAKSPATVVGFDATFGEFSHIGVVFGYSQDHVKWVEERGLGSIKNFYQGIYGGAKVGAFYLASSLLGAESWYKAGRRIELVGLYQTLPTRVASHHNRGWLADGRLEVGAHFGCKTTVRPYVSSNFVFLEERGFQESGADSLNLSVDAYRASAVNLQGGFEVATQVNGSLGSAKPHALLAWSYEKRLKGKRIETTLLINECSFPVYGLNPNRSFLTTDLGIDLGFLEETLVLSLDYIGEIGGGYRNSEGSANLSWSF